MTKNGVPFFPQTHIDAIIGDNGRGVDSEPTAGSENLVRSGGVFDDIIQSGVFDLSVHTGDSYATLQDALSALNALPSDYKRGGMTIRYV